MAVKSENPSIYIPFVFLDTMELDVKGIFEDLGLGEVERVDMIPATSKKSGEPCKRAFVHFTKWGTSVDAVEFRADILKGTQREIVYDEPRSGYLICLKSTSPRPERRQRKYKPRILPRIEHPLTVETPREVIARQTNTIVSLNAQIDTHQRAIRLIWGAAMHAELDVFDSCAPKYRKVLRQCIDNAHEEEFDRNDVFKSNNLWGALGQPLEPPELTYADQLARRWEGYEEWVDEDGYYCCGFPGKESGAVADAV
jgi:hypothetical protein